MGNPFLLEKFNYFLQADVHTAICNSQLADKKIYLQAIERCQNMSSRVEKAPSLDTSQG